MSNLEFNEEKHEYRMDGNVVPHVTGIIADLTDYGMIPPDRLEQARQKGTIVHKMIELHSQGKLGEFEIPGWLEPVVRQWEQFVHDTQFNVIASERRVFHPKFRYACTLDIAATMHGKPGVGIVEVKRSFLAGRAIRLQTAAQAQAWNANYAIDTKGQIDKGHAQHINWRGALKINENGAYRFESHDDPNDFGNFVCCLVHHNLVKEYTT